MQQGNLCIGGSSCTEVVQGGFDLVWEVVPTKDFSILSLPDAWKGSSDVRGYRGRGVGVAWQMVSTLGFFILGLSSSRRGSSEVLG